MRTGSILVVQMKPKVPQKQVGPFVPGIHLQPCSFCLQRRDAIIEGAQNAIHGITSVALQGVHEGDEEIPSPHAPASGR